VSISGHRIDAVVRSFLLNAKPAARFRYAGRYAPP
jgi:hypothetical protein